MQPFTAAPHDVVLILVIQIAVLLLVAKLMGELARRFRQPSVVGEILAGILLGPSLLSSLFPALGQWIVPQTALSGYLLEVVSMIGVMFLLLVTGLETDLGLIKRHARTAIGVSFGGITVTFFTGFWLGRSLPDSLLVDPERRLVFALFVGTAMAISAIPVIAKVMFDMGLMRRDIGQTIIAAGMSDDTIGWMMLSVVAGLAAGEAITAGSVFASVAKVLVFILFTFTLGHWLLKRMVHTVQERFTSPGRIISLSVILAFAWGAITQAMHLEAILGAFFVGILLGNLPRFNADTRHSLETISMSIFSPIFFAVAGLKVNLVQIFQSPRLIGIALLVIAVATFGKVLGTYLGARLIGRRDHWTALSFGAALNARGAMEIIIATIGLQLGILGQDMFSIIVLMAMATSLMAPLALRWTLSHVKPEKQELERLEREALAETSLVAKIQRILHPIRFRPELEVDLQRVESVLLNRLVSSQACDLTLLTVTDPEQKQAAHNFLNQLGGFFQVANLSYKVFESNQPADAILNEAAKDYDLLVLGASKGRNPDDLFNPLIDYVTRISPCPTMIIKADLELGDWQPKRILIPSNGSQSARAAAELAIAFSNQESQLEFLNVVVRRADVYQVDAAGSTWSRELDQAKGLMQDLVRLADGSSVQSRAEVRVADSVEQGILDFSETLKADLIVLGTNLRPVSDRLFLGPNVQRILQKASCPVVVLNVS